MSSSLPRLGAILLLLAAAVAAHQASTSPWGEARGPDLSRYRLAPVGLTRLTDSPSTPPGACRWFPLRGTDPLCQASAGQAGRFTRLTYAYPALQGGAWLSFLAAVVLLLAGPAAAGFARGVVTLATLASVAGVLLVLTCAPVALQALQGLPFRFGGWGLLFGALSPVLAATAGWLMPAATQRAA